MASWFFRRKKGGKLLTPEPSTVGPALSQVVGGDVHIEVGKPRNAHRLKRAQKRVADLTAKRERVIRAMNEGRITAARADEVLKDIEFGIKRHQWQAEVSQRMLDGGRA